MLFRSKIIVGLVINKHGAVIEGGTVIESPSVIAAVTKEAISSGWRWVRSADRDTGKEFVPPGAPDDGKGVE